MISIIGGGPAGLMSSFELAKLGHKCRVYEEHNEIGKPVQCTGIVTADIQDILKIPNRVIQNRIRKAMVVCGSSKATLPVDDLVLDRQGFDRHLADLAEDEGVKITKGKRITSLPKGMVIGADGPAGIVVRHMNPRAQMSYLTGKQAVVEGDFRKDTFTVYLGSIAPDFFGWTVPIDKRTARVGIAALRHTHRQFDSFLRSVPYDRIDSYQAGLIPIYNPRLRTESKRMYLVGDAASQVKATTGGGLVPGLRSSKILAQCISRQNSYSRAWKAGVGKELYMHLRIRKMLDRFTDRDYRKLIGYFGNCSSVFQRHSRDNSIGLAARLLAKEPRLLSFAGKLF